MMIAFSRSSRPLALFGSLFRTSNKFPKFFFGGNARDTIGNPPSTTAVNATLAKQTKRFTLRRMESPAHQPGNAHFRNKKKSSEDWDNLRQSTPRNCQLAETTLDYRRSSAIIDIIISEAAKDRWQQSEFATTAPFARI
eukprot:TRINITY_DN71936_c0_g1_i1.p2 TRINITY_DN71936_c0_g1~~TRINITY_DN71936_c0_g1_i1.p2  ORF type:complete len:139 (+),score=12.18 TRINITY_DN71936_c0_g1_i1:394-810(+)